MIRNLLFSSLTLKTPTKANFLYNFSAYYFLKVHLHHFSKIKSQKEVTKQWNQGFPYYFYLMIEGSESGSVPLTDGSESQRPKNIRIRNTALDLGCMYWLYIYISLSRTHL
jgi:hypothetical protein